MFTLPDLSYAYDALEPHIDAKTMELHHSKHHQTYVDKLNEAIKGTEYAEKDIKEILQNLESLPDDIKTKVRNNGGGHYNHDLFWKIMSPNGGGSPSGDLERLINESFGGFDDFKADVSDAAVGRFGSGWVWLLQDGDKLKLTDTPNQEGPIMEGNEPILGLDVWEHAYYLKYQQKRPDYVEAWWNVVDWKAVADRLK